MLKMPSFLNLGRKPLPTALSDTFSRFEEYQPLLALWLIDIALVCDWPRKLPSDSLASTFADNDYISVTGLTALRQLFPEDSEAWDDDFEIELDTEVEDEPAPVRRRVRRSGAERPRQAKRNSVLRPLVQLLRQRRKLLLSEGVKADLPLFQNVERLGRLLNLNGAEKACLSFAACLTCFDQFRNAFISNLTEVSDGQVASIVAALTGHGEVEVRKALRRDGLLVTSGLVCLNEAGDALEDKLLLVHELRGVILDQLSSDDDLTRRVLRPATPPTLTLADFPHLGSDAALLQDYLRGTIASAERGANILLYGPPGTGKTEFAKALMAQLGITLYEIAYADEKGNPIEGVQRLHSLNFCQRTLQGKGNVALLFDEVEDVLPGSARFSDSFDFGQPAGENKGGKAWINRSLEENPVPTLWITNNATIDPAYLRRFDYSLPLRIPPRKVRARIASEHLGEHAPNLAALDPIADLDDLLPSQLERAARVARITSRQQPQLAWLRAEMALSRSRALLGQTRASFKPRVQTGYSLDFLNTDIPIPAILEGLRRRPHASFCLYGPPGTGKSLLARHVADELGQPLILKRASDLLDKYVGETEQRIAAMFEQARDEGAVLVLDEADSFLGERTGARNAWEVTQTNELLTQLECFDGLFFATTNLMARLDAASIRRFSHKIRFGFLNGDQRWALFRQEYCRLGGVAEPTLPIERAVRRLEELTPGDFAAAIRRLSLRDVPPRVEDFLAELSQEVVAKRRGKGAMGFV
jgi:AAA+ superfamily predicted ATPase